MTQMLDEEVLNHNIKVEAFAIDIASEIKRENMDVKSLLGLNRARVYLRMVSAEIELYSLFPVKPVAGNTMYRSECTTQLNCFDCLCG